MSTNVELLEKFSWAIAIGEKTGKISRGEFTCNVAKGNTIPEFSERKKHVYIGTRPLLLEQSLKILIEPVSPYIIRDPYIVDKAVENFVMWLLQSSNTYLGLDEFSHIDAIDGNTQGFDLFYVRHRNKHIKIMKGEWVYHVQQLETNGFKWSYVEDSPLAEGDAFLISAPFSGSGSIHKSMQKLLNQCDTLNIPVLIDGCFSVVTDAVEYDFRHPCIENITFSCSKIFPLQGAPAGVRFSKTKMKDFQTVKLDREYQNRWSFALMNKFLIIPQKTIIQELKEKQAHWCSIFGLKPLDVAYLGLADDYYKEAHSYWGQVTPHAHMTDYSPMISLVSFIENHKHFVNLTTKILA